MRFGDLKNGFTFAHPNAKVAQLVEHDLAKVGVAGSNPVFRSTQCPLQKRGFFVHPCPGGGIGRHAGLKIPWAVMSVRVQVPSGVQKSRAICAAFLLFAYNLWNFKVVGVPLWRILQGLLMCDGLRYCINA